MMENSIKRKEIIVLDPEIGTYEKVIEYEQDDKKCSVYLSLKGVKEWKLFGYNNEFRKPICVVSSNSICFLFKGFSELENRTIISNFKSEWSKGSIIIANSKYQENTIQIYKLKKDISFEISNLIKNYKYENEFFYFILNDIIKNSFLSTILLVVNDIYFNLTNLK